MQSFWKIHKIYVRKINRILWVTLNPDSTNVKTFYCISSSCLCFSVKLFIWNVLFNNAGILIHYFNTPFLFYAPSYRIEWEKYLEECLRKIGTGKWNLYIFKILWSFKLCWKVSSLLRRVHVNIINQSDRKRRRKYFIYFGFYPEHKNGDIILCFFCFILSDKYCCCFQQSLI